MFVLDGAHGDRWHSQSVGLAQGCPFSPYVAAAITHCWGAWVTSATVQGFGFLDDRTLMLSAGAPPQHMRQALQRSATFDAACGFQTAPDKCFLAAAQHDETSHAIAQDFALQCCQNLDVLGVTVSMHDGGWHLLKFSFRKAVLRLRLLRWTHALVQHKRALVRMLVVPCLAWASGFASPSAEDLDAIKKEVLQLFNPNFGQEAARVLVLEQLGWELEPQFAVDISCLRELWRLYALIHGPSCLDGHRALKQSIREMA